jgi:arylformamidase
MMKEKGCERMKLYDISQEVFSCAVYPGDPQPEKISLYSTKEGDIYNLTSFAMCAHSGTHIDAPFHFLHGGKTVDQLSLHHFVGECYVARHAGDVTAAHAEEILAKACGAKRILIAGNVTVTAEAAEVFANSGIQLLGNEGQSVGPEDAPMQVHLILLKREIALLEGIVLKSVPEGHYFLSAAPLNLGGADGAPCRAYLIDCKDTEIVHG